MAGSDFGRTFHGRRYPDRSVGVDEKFRQKDGSGTPPEDGGRNATVDFKGEKRSNETHQSTTDPDARLYKKSEGNKSCLSCLNHALMENRNDLAVNAETTLATGTTERDAALTMATRSMTKAGSTLGADKGYDAAGFVKELRERKITPHVAQKKHSAIDARTKRHKDYAVSLKKRKLVEEIFGWSKTIGGLRRRALSVWRRSGRNPPVERRKV